MIGRTPGLGSSGFDDSDCDISLPWRPQEGDLIANLHLKVAPDYFWDQGVQATPKLTDRHPVDLYELCLRNSYTPLEKEGGSCRSMRTIYSTHISVKGKMQLSYCDGQPSKLTFCVAKGKFAENLARIMAEKGMSQVELARRSGVSQPQISSYVNESRSAKRPSLTTLVALAAALGVTPNQLLGIPEPPPAKDETEKAAREKEFEEFWGKYQAMTIDDPRRKAINALLGITDEPEKGEGP